MELTSSSLVSGRDRFVLPRRLGFLVSDSNKTILVSGSAGSVVGGESSKKRGRTRVRTKAELFFSLASSLSSYQLWAHLSNQHHLYLLGPLRDVSSCRKGVFVLVGALPSHPCLLASSFDLPPSLSVLRDSSPSDSYPTTRLYSGAAGLRDRRKGDSDVSCDVVRQRGREEVVSLSLEGELSRWLVPFLLFVSRTRGDLPRHILS